MMTGEGAEAKVAGESLLTVAEASKPVPLDDVTMATSGGSGREVARESLLTLTTPTAPDEACARRTRRTVVVRSLEWLMTRRRKRIPANVSNFSTRANLSSGLTCAVSTEDARSHAFRRVTASGEGNTDG